VQEVEANPNITMHLKSRVIASSGLAGNFTSLIQDADGRRQSIAHGVTILASGAQEYRGSDDGYGSHPAILTQSEFEAIFARSPEALDHLQSVAMLLCVGPAEKYCSRICCTVALKNALALKERHPHIQVIILYKDIRVYGLKERLYTEARRRGVIFLRYDEAHRPQVSIEGGPPEASRIVVRAWDLSLGRRMEFSPDALVLSMPVVPNPDSHNLAALFKVPLDADGFFQEAHVKLGPVDFATEGVFMAGMAHYPKLLDEAIVQAQAAAARAARLLSRQALSAGGRVAVVETARCTACLTCVRLCPFHVPQIRADLSGVGGLSGAAYIEPSVCQGCGICAAECPALAIQLMHYKDIQTISKLDALFGLGLERGETREGKIAETPTAPIRLQEP